MNLRYSILQGFLYSGVLVAGLAGHLIPSAMAQSVAFSSSSFIGAGSDGVNSSGPPNTPNQNYDASAGRVSANQRGDVFWINNPFTYGNPNSLVEIPAGNIFGNSTAEVLLVSNLGTGSDTVTVDPLNNLWVQDANDAVLFIPFVNGGYASGLNLATTTPPTCTLPVTSTVACLWPNINAVQLGYYDQLSDIQVDASGNIYGVDIYDGSGEGYGTKNRLVEYSGTTGVPTVLVDNLPFSGSGRLAVTSGGDIYYVDGTNLYHVSAGGSTATTISGFSSPSGVSIDTSGNLYVTDDGNNRIAFVPSVGGTLNFSNAYAVYETATGPGLAHSPVGIDGYGDIFFEYPGYGGAFAKLPGANIRFGIDYSGLGSSAGPQTVNLIFNSAVTFGSFIVTGGSGTAPFTTSNNTCVSGTAYAAGATCSVSVTYTANGVGAQSGMLEALSSTGALLGEARLSAFDVAPLMNIDPGTVTAIGASWHAPSSIAVDAAGNTYVADSSTGGIYKNGNATAIASGFSLPSAVAVDAAGNLYVADTGNNRIRKVPYVSGAYGTAVTIYTGLSGPSGLALDDNGNLYVADSGNSRVLLLASAGGQQLGTVVTTIGSGFTTPVALAVDNYGNNLYVADNGTKTVVQLALATSVQTTVLSGLTTAAGIAVDASDSLYVVDNGAQTISRVGNNQGSFGSSTTLATVVGKPTAIALDTLGDVYAADTADATVAKMARTAGSLSFGSVIAGSSSSPLTATISNGGAIYTTVSLSSPYYTPSGSTADFTIQNSSSCANGYGIYYGYSCTVSAVFNPVSTASYTDTLTFASNVAANTLVLTGTGIGAPTFGSLTVTGFPTTTSPGTAGTVNVSAFDTNGNPMPSFTGTVTLTSSDPYATLPAAYTFQGSDAGVHTFPVTLNTGGTQSITATSGSISASETGIVVGDYIWILNATGTTSKIGESGSSVTTSGFTGGTSSYGGLAFDSNGNVWSVTSGSNSLVFATKTGATPTTYTGGGLSTPVGLAVDGAGSIWIANSGNNSVSEFLNSGTAQSGTSGYGSSGMTALSGPSAVIVDGSGGVWVTNKTGNSVTHILGAATPVVTPLSKAVSTGSVGVKP
jgi:DNA-binding beta-propeller fold protein YncE